MSLDIWKTTFTLNSSAFCKYDRQRDIPYQSHSHATERSEFVFIWALGHLSKYSVFLLIKLKQRATEKNLSKKRREVVIGWNEPGMGALAVEL